MRVITTTGTTTNTRDITKVTKARARNWLKARVLSWGVGAIEITKEEKVIVNEIIRLRQQLIDNWDRNSEEMGFFVRPYRCWLCGQKSNIEYLAPYGAEKVNLCRKHYREQLEIESKK